MGYIKLNSANFFPLPETNQIVKVEYKRIDPPGDTLHLWDNNILMLANGNFSPTLLITGLDDLALYEIYVTMNCGGTYVSAQYYTIESTNPIIIVPIPIGSTTTTSTTLPGQCPVITNVNGNGYVDPPTTTTTTTARRTTTTTTLPGATTTTTTNSGITTTSTINNTPTTTTTTTSNIVTTTTTGLCPGIVSVDATGSTGDPATTTTTTNVAVTTTTTTLCNCPTGYTARPDGSGCYKIFTEQSIQPTAPENLTSRVYFAYSDHGSYIYNLGWNNDGTGTSTQIPLSNSFWVNGDGTGAGSNNVLGPLNRTGVWSTTTQTNGQEVGFVFCINASVEKTYYIGVGADNYIRITSGGYQILEQFPPSLGTQYGLGVSATFKIWHIYPIVLSAGPHTFSVFGHNVESIAAVGVEVYDRTAAQLMAATSYADLGTGLIFSSKDERNLPVQLGTDGIGYSCSSGQFSLDCANNAQCQRIEDINCI